MMNLNYFDFIGSKKQAFEIAKSMDSSVCDPVFIFKISARRFGVAKGQKLFLINGFEIIAKLEG